MLRHHPGSIGIELDAAGWVELDDLLAGLSAHGDRVTRDDVEAVLAAGHKQRYEIAGDRIRATHGHSVEVDLGLRAATPPDVVFHGTVGRFLDAILREGLQPRGRRHVHLSTDAATAREVGARRGRPVVLTVDAAAMHRAGHVFHRASDSVWLTASVPPEHLATDGPLGGEG